SSQLSLPLRIDTERFAPLRVHLQQPYHLAIHSSRRWFRSQRQRRRHMRESPCVVSQIRWFYLPSLSRSTISGASVSKKTAFFTFLRSPSTFPMSAALLSNVPTYRASISSVSR